MQRTRWFLCLLGLTATSLVGIRAGAPPPMVDVLLGGERVRAPLASLAERVPLADDEDFRVAEVGRDARASHHVVAIRTAETPHRHDRHDLFVVMVRGHGTWRVGDETLPVGEGSILSIPRGTVHAFANESAENAIAYAVYSPPFDGKDRVETKQPEHDRTARSRHELRIRNEAGVVRRDRARVRIPLRTTPRAAYNSSM